jgi:hypothetical protein
MKMYAELTGKKNCKKHGIKSLCDNKLAALVPDKDLRLGMLFMPAGVLENLVLQDMQIADEHGCEAA